MPRTTFQKCTHLNRKSSRGSDLGQVGAEGLDDFPPPNPEAGGDAKATVEEYEERRLGLLLGRALGVDGPEGDQGPDGVADVVAAVGEAPEGSGQDLEEGEELGHVRVFRVHDHVLGDAVPVAASRLQQRARARVRPDVALRRLQPEKSIDRSKLFPSLSILEL